MSRKTTRKATKTNTSAATHRGRGRKKIVTLSQYEAEAQAETAVPEPATAAKDATGSPTSSDHGKNAQLTGPGKMSGLDAVALVLREAGTAMTTGDMVKVAFEKGYWATGGKTPAATIYSAIVREITVKADQSRFRKTDRGHFELTEAGKQAQ